MKHLILFFALAFSLLSHAQNATASLYEKHLLFNDSRLYQIKDTSEIIYNRYNGALVSVKMYYSKTKLIHGEFIPKDATNFYFTEYDSKGNIITKGLVFVATKAFYTDTLKNMSPITLRTTSINYHQYYRLKRTSNWEYFIVDSIHEKNIIFKNDTAIKTEILNKIEIVNPDSLSKKIVGLWYAHISKSNSDYILLTKYNRDYNFNFTSNFHPDFTYNTELRFIENTSEKGFNIGKWRLGDFRTIHLNFENGSVQSYKIAYLSQDVIILNLN